MAFFEITLRYLGDKPDDVLTVRRIKAAEEVDQCRVDALGETFKDMVRMVQKERTMKRPARHAH